MIKNSLPLAIFLLMVLTASFLGSSFDAGEWYHVTMKQPTWSPPGWLFSLIWALVYVLAAVAAWIVWLTGHPARIGALTWWVLLLLLNVGWSALFFGWHRVGWAVPLLGLMIILTLLCTRAFALISRRAAWLMAAYLVWMVMLWVFNFEIWTINGGFFERFLT